MSRSAQLKEDFGKILKKWEKALDQPATDLSREHGVFYPIYILKRPLSSRRIPTEFLCPRQVSGRAG